MREKDKCGPYERSCSLPENKNSFRCKSSALESNRLEAEICVRSALIVSQQSVAAETPQQPSWAAFRFHSMGAKQLRQPRSARAKLGIILWCELWCAA